MSKNCTRELERIIFERLKLMGFFILEREGRDNNFSLLHRLSEGVHNDIWHLHERWGFKG